MIISTILSSYNGSLFLRQQINSILHQEVSIDELVIIDDCSTDDSVEIIKDLMLKDQRITLLENKQNLGVNKSLEIALRKTKGSVVFFSDQDDVWLPCKTKEFLFEFKKTGKSVIYSDASVIEDNIIIYKSELNYHGHADFFTNPISLAFTNCLPGHNMMITREYAVSLLPFPEVSFYDHWIAVNASLDAEIGLIRKELLLHRIHQANQVNNLFKKKRPEPKNLKRARSNAGLHEVFSLINNKSDQGSLEYDISKSILSLKNIKIYNIKAFIKCIINRDVFFPRMPLLKAIRKSHKVAAGLSHQKNKFY